jgi:hypothetical protein
VSQSRPSAATLCGCQLPPKRLRLNVVRADALAVELDHRDQLAVTPLELRVAVDRDLADGEPQLLAQGEELRTRPLAQVASLGLVEDDAGFYGVYG